MTATAARPRLPVMMPAERRLIVLPDLQAQYDVLAEAFARTFEAMAAQAIRIDALERKIKLPKRLAEVEPFAFVLPAKSNAPARRCFDAAGLLGAIAERQR